MARYVDGYVVPVPKKNVGKYKRMAQQAGKMWRKFGALEYIEAVADDVKKGKVTSFPRSVKAKGNETVVFAYVVYKSRAHRDKVNKLVMKEFEKQGCNMDDMPFDGMRMFWGGFKVLVDA